MKLGLVSLHKSDTVFDQSDPSGQFCQRSALTHLLQLFTVVPCTLNDLEMSVTSVFDGIWGSD